MSAVLFLLSCSGTPPEPSASPDAPTTTGSQALVTLDRVKVTADLAVLRSAIRSHRAMNEDELPASLDSLNHGTLSYPDAYTYDAATGEVHCAELPNL